MTIGETDMTEEFDENEIGFDCIVPAAEPRARHKPAEPGLGVA